MTDVALLTAGMMLVIAACIATGWVQLRQVDALKRLDAVLVTFMQSTVENLKVFEEFMHDRHDAHESFGAYQETLHSLLSRMEELDRQGRELRQYLVQLAAAKDYPSPPVWAPNPWLRLALDATTVMDATKVLTGSASERKAIEAPKS